MPRGYEIGCLATLMAKADVTTLTGVALILIGKHEWETLREFAANGTCSYNTASIIRLGSRERLKIEPNRELDVTVNGFNLL